MAKTLNVFKGKHALRDFLNPGKHPYLPLVELPPRLNPYANDKVLIFAKLMTFSPLGNVKALPGFNMMQGLYRRGELEGVHRAVENSSGNTVSAIALAARQFGVAQTRSFVPHEISWHKLLMLLFFDVKPIVNQEPPVPAPTDPRSGVCKARLRGRQDDWVNPGQYDNPDNPKSHQKWTGRQIWEQTEGRIDVFCAGLGTTGTLTGTAKTLKRNKRSIRIVGVMREDDNYVPGVRTESLLKLIGFDWQSQVDEVEKVETAPSYRASMALSRNGIVVGPSAGFAYTGLLNFLERHKTCGTLEQLRSNGRNIVCVFICPDTPIPYLDEYFKYLQPSDFPAIENEHLLVNRPAR